MGVRQQHLEHARPHRNIRADDFGADVRAAPEDAEVESLDIERADVREDAVVGEQGPGEIGAG